MGAPSACRQRTAIAVGAAAPGAVTITGAEVGDTVAAVIGVVTTGAAPVAVPEGQFEQVISVAGQIQQLLAGNLSANTYSFVLYSRA